MTTSNPIGNTILVSNAVSSTNEQPSCDRPQASYRTPQLLQVGSATELLQGPPAGSFADVRGRWWV
jgi:hypothetical protein